MLKDSLKIKGLNTEEGPPPRILVLFGSGAIFGAERGNLEALSALKSRGAEVLCLIRDETWSHIVPSTLTSRGIAWRKIPYVEQWRPSRAHVVLFRGPWAWIAANFYFLRAIRDFKPTHIHAYGQLFVLNFAIGLWLTKTPLVFRAGDEPTLHNALWRTIWRFTVARTSRFVANAEFVARSLCKNGVPFNHIEVIYNVPPRRTNLSNERIDLSISENTRVIAFIGQIAAHKGPHILISAFRKLVSEFPDIHLAIAGRISDWSGDAWARSLRDQTLKDSLIANRVTFLGEINNVQKLLTRCEFLVVPSLFDDPSPNVIMEAKQAGKACIAFPRGGIPELIEDELDGIICLETNQEALTKALRRYCLDPTLAASHGARGLETIARFSHAEFSDRWLAVYMASSVHRE